MRHVAENLSQFIIEEDDVQVHSRPEELDSLESLQSATKIYGEDEMSALESEELNRLTV